MGFAIVKTINYRKLSENGAKIEGTVFFGFRYITWKYQVAGQMYEVRLSKSDYPFIIDGEKYVVYYDIKNPSSSIMSFTEPIIDPNMFDTITSIPLNANYDKGSKLISFYYIYKGDTIKREHRYKFNKSFSVKEKTFPIYINSKNPKISYINFEQ
jgi:hypothetical protein